MLDATRLDARQRLIGHITSCWRTQALEVAVALDLPDRLAAGGGDAVALARACECSEDGMVRILRALCALGVCRERTGGTFTLTPGGQSLRRQPPDGGPSLRALVSWWSGPMWPLWAELGFSVRTGRSVRERETGLANYAFLEQDSARAALFHGAMQAMTALIAPEVARLGLWRGMTDLVDVGGGQGELAAVIALAHPALRVRVLDLRHAQASANAHLGQAALAGRAAFVVGDFFQAVPAGADGYLLKSILHNWDDAACQRILACCAAGAPVGARLVLVERLRPDRLRPTRRDEAVARTDLNMLAGLGGRERSLAEFGALLRPAGFEIRQAIPCRHEFSVVVAERV